MSIYPKISVVMAINQDNDYLEKAIQSVLNQTFSDFEFIIVANGCDELLWDKLNRIIDCRIILKRLSLGGFAFALNYGISISGGEYIARMDADDISHRERFERQYSYMQKHHDVDLLGTGCEFIDENDALIENRHFKIVNDNNSIRKCLPYRNPIIHASMFARRELLVNVGGYKYGLMSEDHELFIRLSRDENFRFANLSEKLYMYRRHSAQITSMNKVYTSYYEISAFLFSEFLRSKNIKYLLGILRVHPITRKVYNKVRNRK